MTAEQLSAIAGVVLSLAFSYIPGIRERFDALQPTAKASVMAVVLLVVSVLAFAAACGNLLEDFPVQLLCSQRGAVGLFMTYITALIANQATYTIAVKPRQKKDTVIRASLEQPQ